MGYQKLVTLLFLTTTFFFHLNLSSKDSINLQLLSNHKDEKTSTQPTNEVSLQMENLSTANHPKSELYYRFIYPSEVIFREFIVSTLNSEKICDLYKFFYSKDPSISHLKFLPAERFFRTHALITTENQQQILYNFQFGVQEPETQFSKFHPIIYNPTDNTLQTINPYDFDVFRLETTPDGCPLTIIEDEFLPFIPKLNTKPLGDENKTVMIATEKKANNFFLKFLLILEDSTNKNLKKYSVICHGESYNQYNAIDETSLMLYQSYGDREEVEYPKDIEFILKARYISGIKKYFFKFQYGHIKICQKVFTSRIQFVSKLSDFSDEVLENNDVSSCRNRFLRCPMYVVRLAKRLDEFSTWGPEEENPTKFKQGLHSIAMFMNFLFLAYVWLTPYKAIIGFVLSPLYFYLSPYAFLLAFNLEPLSSALFYGPTHVYVDLQFDRKYYQIYPLQIEHHQDR